ncbi:uncharacterized protein LOC134191601 [Corticium candelabrum]|uniref:uncharacterized protein LOC134191601 n=1 Tax=Corticium candelabrum TaxID=121492 RepID=UPI002E26D3A3|nr:uncharacterized protein LOC134191601 [Corticium candelabrum]
MTDVKRKSLDKSGGTESCRAIMVICCVPGCTNVSAKGKYLKFHMEIFVTWINFIAIYLNDVDWYLPRDTLHRSLPQSFRETFPKKTCIIDATELFTERHSDRDRD